MIDEALARKLRLQGITKAARHPMFRGRRKNTKEGNYSAHVCYICGEWRDCEMEKCTHAVCVRVLACCDPHILEKRKNR